MFDRISLFDRIINKSRRTTVKYFGCRRYKLGNHDPIISFTFDDFPRSALVVGGSILKENAATGTFYVSMGLLGQESNSGRIASLCDIQRLISEGHELGCHTYSHQDGWKVRLQVFKESIAANQKALGEYFPNRRFHVFAYPLNGPSIRIKNTIGNYFICCRGGGQKINSNIIDLNLLKAYFLDWRNRETSTVHREVIRKCVATRGWLIFATHDVDPNPSRYGCTPSLLEELISYARKAGARILPVAKACEELGITALNQSLFPFTK